MQLVEDDVASRRRSAPASGVASSSATCSGVVSRMSGGSSFWRWRLCAGVSPVRVSRRDRQPHLGDRLAEVARDVDGERLQRRDVERVDAAMRLAGLALRPRRRARSATAGSRPASCRRRSARSAAPTAGLRLGEQLDLMGARRPAALGEPFQERFGQQGGRAVFGKDACCVTARRGSAARRAAKRNLEQTVIRHERCRIPSPVALVARGVAAVSVSPPQSAPPREHSDPGGSQPRPTRRCEEAGVAQGILRHHDQALDRCAAILRMISRSSDDRQARSPTDTQYIGSHARSGVIAQHEARARRALDGEGERPAGEPTATARRCASSAPRYMKTSAAVTRSAPPRGSDSACRSALASLS